MKPEVEAIVASWQKSRAVSAGNSHTSRLAGMIQVCRPSWSAGVTCHAARTLLNEGVREFRAVDTLAGYLSYLETELLRYTESSPDAPLLGDACELEVKGWFVYWKLYRDSTTDAADDLPAVMQHAR